MLDGSLNTEQLWTQLINDVDTNKDGMISFDEFRNMMLSFATQKLNRSESLKDASKI